MEKIKRIALSLTICAGLALPTVTGADLVLEYMVKGMNVPAGTPQNIAVKNDRPCLKIVRGEL